MFMFIMTITYSDMYRTVRKRINHITSIVKVYLKKQAIVTILRSFQGAAPVAAAGTRTGLP